MRVVNPMPRNRPPKPPKPDLIEETWRAMNPGIEIPPKLLVKGKRLGSAHNPPYDHEHWKRHG